jgi:hypothetical protein
VNEYVFSFMDHMGPYCDPREIQRIYLYLNSMEEFQYKNIWNLLHRTWSSLCARAIQEVPTYKRTVYYRSPRTTYIHTDLTDDTFNARLQDFIGTDMLKSLIVMEVVMRHGIPKR